MRAPVDDVFHALADPTRRRILEQLGRRSMSVSELAEPLTMSLPAVLQHVTVLDRSGLVESTKRGRVRMCALRPQALAAVEEWMRARHADWERRLDLLDDFLGEGGHA